MQYWVLLKARVLLLFWRGKVFNLGQFRSEQSESHLAFNNQEQGQQQQQETTGDYQIMFEDKQKNFDKYPFQPKSTDCEDK